VPGQYSPVSNRGHGQAILGREFSALYARNSLSTVIFYPPVRHILMSSHETMLLEAYDRFADAIFRHCYFRVSDREKAKELMQETFLKAWQSICDGQEVKSIKSYLYRIANNLIIDHYRKKKDISLDILQDEGFDPGVDEREQLENFIAGKSAMTLLENLTEPYRQVVVMRYVDDYSVSEIAEVLEVSPNVVSVRLNRALRKLRSLYTHE